MSIFTVSFLFSIFLYLSIHLSYVSFFPSVLFSPLFPSFTSYFCPSICIFHSFSIFFYLFSLYDFCSLSIPTFLQNWQKNWRPIFKKFFLQTSWEKPVTCFFFFRAFLSSKTYIYSKLDSKRKKIKKQSKKSKLKLVATGDFSLFKFTAIRWLRSRQVDLQIYMWQRFTLVGCGNLAIERHFRFVQILKYSNSYF